MQLMADEHRVRIMCRAAANNPVCSNTSRPVTSPILTRDLSADHLAFTDWSPPHQHRYPNTETQKHCIEWWYQHTATSFPDPSSQRECEGNIMGNIKYIQYTYTDSKFVSAEDPKRGQEKLSVKSNLKKKREKKRSFTTIVLWLHIFKLLSVHSHQMSHH